MVAWERNVVEHDLSVTKLTSLRNRLMAMCQYAQNISLMLAVVPLKL